MVTNNFSLSTCKLSDFVKLYWVNGDTELKLVTEICIVT